MAKKRLEKMRKAFHDGKNKIDEKTPDIMKDTMGKGLDVTRKASIFVGKKAKDSVAIVGNKAAEGFDHVKEKVPDTIKQGIEITKKTGEVVSDKAVEAAGVLKDKTITGVDHAKELIEQRAPTQDEIIEALGVCYGQAIDGIPKVSGTIEDLVDDYLSRYDTTEQAAKALINYQILKCTTSGFLTGLGGVITLPVTIPVNIGTVWYVQIRMIAALAKMGGFDPRTDQVQTLVYACLTGQAITDILKRSGIEFGKKFTTASISKISGATLTKINQAVGFRFVTKFGEKGIINLGKTVPIVGGFIGGGFDFATTRVIANNAYRMFVAQSDVSEDVVEIDAENNLEDIQE